LNVLNIYKPVSITPFQLIEKIKNAYSDIYDKKIAYAGRLDPMAQGVMIYLVGEEVKQRDKYQKLQKIYTTKVIFGTTTDTYDPLGTITSVNQSDINAAKKASHIFSKEYMGLLLQKYPPFSYPKINGEPMYRLAREGRLKEKDIPEKEVFVYANQVGNFREIFLNEIRSDIVHKISNVNGDFRQKEIINEWVGLENIKLIVADAQFEVSSGTYIRSLVHELGKMSGCGAIAYDITRTQVGEYRIEDSVRL